MPLPTISTSDFTGYLAISSDRFNDSVLTDYISVFVVDYVRYFLGDQLYVAIRDAVANPDKYTDLLNGTEYTDSNDKLHVVSGLTSILKAMIYYEYVRKQRYANTVNGVEVAKNENSQTGTSANAYVQAWGRYTRSIEQYNAEIVCFLAYYDTIDVSIDSSVDLGGGGYTINLASTKYLSDGDAVTVAGVDYTVANLVADTSFDISGASSGLNFAGAVACWKPFDGAVYCRKESTMF